MKKMLSLLVLVILSAPVFAQVPEYGQCGGIGYTGPTECVSGFTCTVANAYYSQCLPGGSDGGSSGSSDSADEDTNTNETAHCYTLSTYQCDPSDASAGFATTCSFTGYYGDPKSCTSVGCGIIGVLTMSTRHCVLKTK